MLRVDQTPLVVVISGASSGPVDAGVLTMACVGIGIKCLSRPIFRKSPTRPARVHRAGPEPSADTVPPGMAARCWLPVRAAWNQVRRAGRSRCSAGAPDYTAGRARVDDGPAAERMAALRDAARHHPRVEIVSRLARRSHPPLHLRRLRARGPSSSCTPSTRSASSPASAVATLAWNHYRHLEAYFGVPCTGRVLHTAQRAAVAPTSWRTSSATPTTGRSSSTPTCCPCWSRSATSCPALEHVVVLADDVPATTLPDVVAYEELLAGQPDDYDQPRHRRAHAAAGSATPRAPPAGPRAWCTRTGPRSCTPWPSPPAPAWHRPAATACCRWCRCSTPTPGACPTRPWPSGAKQVFYAGAARRRAVRRPAASTKRVTVAAGCPPSGSAVADELTARRARCPTLRHIVCGGSQPPRCADRALPHATSASRSSRRGG